jgi:ATP-dependent protease Clp ATPase subunit
MKILAWVVVAVLAATSCKTLGPVIWPTTVQCLSAPASAVVAKVRVIVEQDGLAGAFSDDAIKALEELARQYGPEVIACVLRELINEYTAPTGFAAPPDRLAAARRSQHFLNEQQIQVQEQ